MLYHLRGIYIHFLFFLSNHWLIQHQNISILHQKYLLQTPHEIMTFLTSIIIEETMMNNRCFIPTGNSILNLQGKITPYLISSKRIILIWFASRLASLFCSCVPCFLARTFVRAFYSVSLPPPINGAPLVYSQIFHLSPLLLSKALGEWAHREVPLFLHRPVSSNNTLSKIYELTFELTIRILFWWELNW